MATKYTLEQFIEKARKKHGYKYDYSKTKYIHSHTHTTIICPVHGEFEQTPNVHLAGKGCRQCGIIKRSNSVKLKMYGPNSFMSKARKLHGQKYDYSKTEYVTSNDYVTIICPIHGEFEQQPCQHFLGHGCPACADEENSKRLQKINPNNYKYNKNLRALNRRSFIERSRKIHKNKYNYSDVNYINQTTKVRIRCPVHGFFSQVPYAHLRNQGCPSCGKERNIERMIKESESRKGKKAFTNHKGKVEYA